MANESDPTIAQKNEFAPDSDFAHVDQPPSDEAADDAELRREAKKLLLVLNSNLGGGFRFLPGGFFRNVMTIATELKKANHELRQSSEASDRLSNALNRITRWGVVVGAAGVLIAAGHLGL